MDLHDIANQVAKTSGADFAFVLSQAGLLVTRDAPHNMPDSGRMKILWACPRGKSDIVHLELPREQLVPFGGAAPIDVFAVRVEDTAILVAVMASWNDKSNVVLALTAGAASLAEMIRKAKRVRAQKVAAKKQAEGTRRDRASTLPEESPRRERSSTLPGESPRRERSSTLPGESPRRERSSKLPAEPRRERSSKLPPEPARRDRASALPKAPKEAAAKGIRFMPSDSPEAAARARGEAPTSAREPVSSKRRTGEGKGRASSEPEIVIGEDAAVGRETMIAIEMDFHRSATLPGEPPSSKRRTGEGKARGSSEPEIRVGEAPVGRETLVAIETDLHRPAGPTPEAVRVELVSIGRETLADIARAEAAEIARSPTVEEPLVVLDRRTLPWVDPSAIKRAIDASAKARAVAPPEVKVAIEELDPDALERALRDEKR